MKTFNEENKVVDFTDENIIHLWEPYVRWNMDIRANEKYDFQVVCSHFSSSLDELQLIYKITDEKQNKSFYMLGNYEVGSDEYIELLKNLYCGSISEGEIFSVREEDFLYFRGDAHLDIINDCPVINFHSMDTDESPYSIIHSYLYKKNVD